MGNRNDPRVAYRYGRGEAVSLPGGARSQLRVPLDFMAVTDHDLWLGRSPSARTPGIAPTTLTSAGPCAGPIRTTTLREICSQGSSRATSMSAPPGHNTEICGDVPAGGRNKCLERAHSVWQQIQRNADEFYQSGLFTTFAGFE